MVICAMAFFIIGCEKQQKQVTNELIMKESAVKQSVKGWQLYTNPAFRYELRFPQGWRVTDSGEDGLIARFFSANAADDSVKILGYTNWKQQFSLQEFYENQSVDILKADAPREDVEINGQAGLWLKNVKGRVAAYPEKLVDLIVFDLGDRIVEVEISGNWETSKIIVNSLKFYDNNSITIDK